MEDKFINDASLMTSDDEEMGAVQRLQENTQRHEKYLYSTGGRLAMHKCFWTIVKYEWEDGEAHMEEYDTEESSKNGTTDKRVTLTSGGEVSKIHVIRRIGANQSYRSLGVFLATNGCQLKQKQVLQEKSRTWSIKMRNSFLTGEEKLISYRQQLLPSLQFPLSCTMMTQQ